MGGNKQFAYALGASVALCLAHSGAQANGANHFGIGIEGFRETYKESDLDSNSTANYGSITGYFSHDMGRSFFAIDGRGSYGTQRYSAADNANNPPLPTGSVTAVPQWEFELRGRYGKTYEVWDGNFSPYIGLGVLYHRDEGKGYFTNSLIGGFEDYDRNTWQFYIPVGASYSYSFGDGWSVTPQAEADIMFYGNVTDRVTNTFEFGTFNHPADNTQHFGFGGRSEFMFGKDMGGYNIEMGPFIRYWWVQKSDSTNYNIVGGTGVFPVSEPENTRVQIGAAVRLLW